MSTVAATMTPEQAREFRAAYDAEARRLTRLSRRDLPAADAFCGAYSKDELIRRVMDLDGYTITRLNEAIHVLHHADAVWPDCPLCAEVTP